MELEANQAPHEFIYIDEAGFNLAKRRRRGQNEIGKRATVDVPGQRGANISMCAEIANAGLLLHRCQVGPYNTERLLAFLNDLHQHLVPEQDQEGENMRTFVITWDNVAFHHSQTITTWFEVHPRLVSLFLPPYSPCVFHGYFVHCKQYCKTFSVLSYRVSTVPPVVNSKGKKKNLFAFYWNAFECEHYCICGHTVPNQEM